MEVWIAIRVGVAGIGEGSGGTVPAEMGMGVRWRRVELMEMVGRSRVGSMRGVPEAVSIVPMMV